MAMLKYYYNCHGPTKKFYMVGDWWNKLVPGKGR